MTYASFVKHYEPVYETRYKGNADTSKRRSNKSQKHQPSPPSSTPKSSELEDLADDHFFHDQIRRDRKLKDHTLKKDVEVFDLKQMRRFGESAEDKTTDKPVILKDVGSSKEKNFEFVHDAKKLGKNAKYRFDLEKELSSLKCVECESLDSIPESGEEIEGQDKDKEKVKIIDDFQRRIYDRRDKRVYG